MHFNMQEFFQHILNLRAAGVFLYMLLLIVVKRSVPSRRHQRDSLLQFPSISV